MQFVGQKLTNLSITKTLILSLLVPCLLLGDCSSVLAFTPESPEVRKLVKRAVKFLGQDHIYDDGHRALCAMAVFKSGEPVTHPLVAAALKDAVDICRTPETVDRVLNSIYELAVVGILLSEVDAKRYENEIVNIIQVLEKRQKEFGGWGYPKPLANWEYGDTSMTQYAVLAAWMSQSVGASEVSQEAIRKVTYWLIRTQDPSGAWGYQGRDPGASSFSKRVAQTEVRPSLGVAGLGSLYICSGMLGLTPDLTPAEPDPDLPAALKPVATTSESDFKPARARGAANVDEKLLKRAIRDGNTWYQAHGVIPRVHTAYYLYTLERYQSFKEITEGRNPKEPRWYNDGVRFLQKAQKRKGEWDIEGGEGKLADTAFAVLFLVRSTKKTIAKANAEYGGRLVAGRGLPSKTGDIRMNRGKVVTTPFQGTAESLLEILSNESHPDFDSVAQLQAIPLSRNPKTRQQQQKRMQRLVHAESFKARLVAVKTLAKLRDLDNVPTLIYALSDPDVRVMVAARDALRFTGRKFQGFGLTEDASADERKTSIEAWKSWYREIRPDAVFVGK